MKNSKVLKLMYIYNSNREFGNFKNYSNYSIKDEEVWKLNVKSFKSLSLNLSAERLNIRNLLPHISVKVGGYRFNASSLVL